MINESLWKDLLANPPAVEGIVRRRILAQLPVDVFVAISFPTRERQIIYSISNLQSSLPNIEATRLVEPSIVIHEHANVTELRLRLLSTEASDVFNAFCNDLVNQLRDISDQMEGLAVVIKRYNLWRRLLGLSGNSFLSEIEQQGLYGELSLLHDLVNLIDHESAIGCWVGPDRDPVDFHCGLRGLEIKTIGGVDSNWIKISSENQLALVAFQKLYLCVYRLQQVSKSVGTNLNQKVEQLRSILQGQPSEIFEQKLLSVGYSTIHSEKYEAKYYEVSEQTLYEVTDDFPRLTPRNIPIGIEAVSYSLSLNVCADFRIELDPACALIGR